MSAEKNSLLESVIQITGERDKRSLIKILVENLFDFIDCDSIIFLQIPHVAGSDYLEVVLSLPEMPRQNWLEIIPSEGGLNRVKRDKNASRCIDSMEIVSAEVDGAKRVLFPIMISGSVTAVLDVYGYENFSETEKTVLSFLQIYSNFLTIIHDGERDTLTGLLNRKTFDSQFSELLFDVGDRDDSSLPAKNDRRTNKEERFHWVGLLDIDHFKNINDRYGHVYGDEVLLLFAGILKESFRDSDLLFRYGGEEFLVVISPVNEAGALAVFERFRQRVEQFNFPQIGRVTVSIGMVKVDQREHQTIIIERADRALYYAKNHGRNQVCTYHGLVEQGALEVHEARSDIELF